MKSYFNDIRDFHEKFSLEYNGPPRQLHGDFGQFRSKFMAEELAEYLGFDDAEKKFFCDLAVMKSEWTSLEHQLDALVDLVYVAVGTAYMHGFDFDEAWRRVHEANMKKVRAVKASDSLRGSTYDVVKPPGWKPADLSDLVSNDDSGPSVLGEE